MALPQQPKAVSPQSATSTAAIATVCHLVAGGAIVKVWDILQMDVTTQAQNRQLAFMCVLAIIALAAGVTLLHILITNYKCWVTHAYTVAATHEAAALQAAPGKKEGPKKESRNEGKDAPQEQTKSEQPAEQPQGKRQRRRWRF